MEQQVITTQMLELTEGTLEWHIRAFVSKMNEKRNGLLAEHGIVESDIEVLRFLDTHEIKKMKDLGDLFGLKFSTLTSTVDRLENNRLVKRKPSKDDRRVVFVSIAPRGRALLTELVKLYTNISQDMTNTMTSTQIDVLMDVFGKFSHT